MSMEHLRAYLTRIFPHAGDPLVTNRRRPILQFVEDTSPGIHDTPMAACDDYRYRLLGCTAYHDNCTDNLFAAMRQVGLRAPECPSPLNLWMNIPVGEDGRTEWGVPVSKPGDYVVLRAELDCVIAMSACPQDILPINGAARQPTEAMAILIIGPHVVTGTPPAAPMTRRLPQRGSAGPAIDGSRQLALPGSSTPACNRTRASSGAATPTCRPKPWPIRTSSPASLWPGEAIARACNAELIGFPAFVLWLLTLMK
jgi:hypothetical protein